jgi:cell division protein FtsI (penicillin-binding protein 3)
VIHTKEAMAKFLLARGFEVSSNTVLVQAVYNNYKNNPKQFVEHLNKFGLNKPLGLPIKGEGNLYIPQPSQIKTGLIFLFRGWLLAMEYQLLHCKHLTLYNAMANNGEMVKPQFVSEIKEWNKTIKKFDKEVINPKICSKETLLKSKSRFGKCSKKRNSIKIIFQRFSNGW